jgi:hypothetical protein
MHFGKQESSKLSQHGRPETGKRTQKTGCARVP